VPTGRACARPTDVVEVIANPLEASVNDDLPVETSEYLETKHVAYAAAVSTRNLHGCSFPNRGAKCLGQISTTTILEDTSISLIENTPPMQSSFPSEPAGERRLAGLPRSPKSPLRPARADPKWPHQSPGCSDPTSGARVTSNAGRLITTRPCSILNLQPVHSLDAFERELPGTGINDAGYKL
jgi:hypothetical protein